MAVRQKKDGAFLVYYREPETGRQKNEYFGKGVEAMAAAWRRNDELGLGRSRKKKNRQTEITFADLTKAYLRAKSFSDKSRAEVKRRLAVHILPAFGQRPAMAITEADLDTYVKARRQSRNRNYKDPKKAPGVKASTVNREITDIKAILNFGAKRKPPLIPWNPVRDYKKPADDYDVILPPTADETKRILAAASDTLKRAITLSYYLGVRPGAVELLTLHWETAVDWDGGCVRIRSANKGGPPVRSVPIHEQLLPVLRAWHDEDGGSGPMVHYNGRAITKLQKSWERALERAGIKRRLRPYDLRHHFVTRALEGGADIGALAEITGTRPETLRRHYQHVTRELHRRTVGKIPGL